MIRTPVVSILVLTLALPVLAKGDRLPPGIEIRGRILLDGGKPAPGALLTAVHLESGRVFRAEPTSAEGRYTLAKLPFGYYEAAIETDGALYAAPQPFNLAPGRSESLDFKLFPSKLPASLMDGAEAAIQIPGMDRKASAIAAVEGLDRPPFRKTPLGIATIVGGTAMLLLLLTGGGGGGGY